MEFLEKIPYLLSLFAPIALFFALGLWIAWWLWYRHAARLETAYAANINLGEKIETGKREERELSARALALVSSSEQKWGAAIGEKDTELLGLNRRFDELKLEADGYRGDLDAKAGELGELNVKFADLGKENETQIAGLLGKVSGFEGDLSKRDDDLKKLNATLGTKDKELEGLRADLKDRSGEINKLKADFDGRDAEIQTLKSSLTDNGANLEKAEAQLNDRESELTGLRADLSSRDGELEKARAELDAKQAAAAKLEAQIAEADKKAAGLQGELTGKEDELKKLQGEHANLQSSLRSKANDLEQARAELDKLRGDLEAKQATAAKLEAKVVEGENRVIGLQKDSDMKIQSLSSDVSKREGIVKQLEAKFVEVENTATNRQKESDMKIQGLSSDVTDRDSTIKQLEARLSEIEKKAAGLQKDSEMKIQGLSSNVSKRDDTIKQLEAQLADAAALADQLKKSEASLAARDSQLQKLSVDVEARDGDLMALKSNFATKEKEVQGLKSDVGQWRAKAEDNSELEGVKTRLRDANSALAKEKESAVRQASGMALFDGESVSEDKSLGFVYKGKPDKVDDLTRVKGVGDVIVKKLHDFGVYRFKQVALWRQDQIDAFSEKLSFKGRIEREIWVNQAADLHFADYGQRLRPVVDIYHPPTSRVVVKGSDPAAVDAAFEGENVNRDAKLGLVYKSRPAEIDDLKRISGVAEVLEGKLHDFGIYRFKQVALWQQEQIDEFSQRLNFSDRVYREMWVHQAVDFHFDKYDEHLTPQVEIYRKPKRPVAVKAKPKEEVDKSFAGEQVKQDEKLGLIFTKRPAKVDDLKRIKGVAFVLEAKLHEFGVYRFKQISMWNRDQIAEFSERLSFRDRVERDDWKGQAERFHNEAIT
ncbi:hypothetical protein OAF27_00900 [Verrucomicrobiales bacterium]|nr:hypothetical protein [Verrucomicrobiales bacterium]